MSEVVTVEVDVPPGPRLRPGRVIQSRPTPPPPRTHAVPVTPPTEPATAVRPETTEAPVLTVPGTEGVHDGDVPGPNPSRLVPSGPTTPTPGIVSDKHSSPHAGPSSSSASSVGTGSAH